MERKKRGRPKRPDRFEIIVLKCVVCQEEFKREKYIEERRVKKGKIGPICSRRCSGKLGGMISVIRKKIESV